MVVFHEQDGQAGFSQVDACEDEVKLWRKKRKIDARHSTRMINKSL